MKHSKTTSANDAGVFFSDCFGNDRRAKSPKKDELGLTLKK